jgi:hypothetical protein
VSASQPHGSQPRPGDEARFDAELRTAARGLVHGELPDGVLDPQFVPARAGIRDGLVPGLAAAAVVVVLLLGVTALVIAPGSPFGPGTTGSAPVSTPVPTPAPFRGTSEIVGHVVAQGYSCNDGYKLPTSGPSAGPAVRESAVCNAPEDIGALIAAIIVGEGVSGDVVTIWMHADIMGEDSPTNRDAVARVLAKLALMSFAGAEAGRAASDAMLWHLPRLVHGETWTGDVAGHRLTIERHQNGGYRVTITPLAS